MANSFDDAEEKDGLTLSNWNDINPMAIDGNRNNFKQTEALSKPYYIKNASDGLPAVKFDSNRHFNFPGELLVNTDFTMFVVERKLTNSDTWIMSQAPWPWACNPNWCLHIGYRNNTVFTFDYFYNGIDYSSNNLPGTQTRIHTFYFNKLSGKKYWLNGGVTPDASDNNLNSLATGITHKLGFSYNGYIFEIICYNRAINENERIDIEKYLSKKYSVPII